VWAVGWVVLVVTGLSRWVSLTKKGFWALYPLWQVFFKSYLQVQVF
jgi:hypothetical protein